VKVRERAAVMTGFFYFFFFFLQDIKLRVKCERLRHFLAIDDRPQAHSNAASQRVKDYPRELKITQSTLPQTGNLSRTPPLSQLVSATISQLRHMQFHQKNDCKNSGTWKSFFLEEIDV